MSKLKTQMDKGGHYDVELKGWMQRGHYDVEINLDGHRGHYNFQIKRADG